MTVPAASQPLAPVTADATVIPFPATMSAERRIDVALGRMQAEGRMLSTNAAALSRSAGQLRSLADSMDQSVERLGAIHDRLAAQQERSRAIAAEADRIEAMIASGQLALAESSYESLIGAVSDRRR